MRDRESTHNLKRCSTAKYLSNLPDISRILDPDSWIELAEEFDRMDHPYSAAGARRRLEVFQQILDEESRVGLGKAKLPHKNYP